ncbi:hypothetical protein T08_10217 [Trichinella sp. T8]|nr:hypothetical protein T08_10217 [Trichinella sp. T8]
MSFGRTEEDAPEFICKFQHYGTEINLMKIIARKQNSKNNITYVVRAEFSFMQNLLTIRAAVQ